MRKITSANLEQAISYAYKLRNKKEYKKAFKLAQMCLKEFPSEAKVQCLLGVLYYDKNEINEALQWLQSAIISNPELPESYFILGQIEGSIGKISEAIESFKKCIQYNPKHVDALFQLGAINVKLQKWQEALSFFQRIIAVDPANQKAYYNMGVIYQVQNKLGEAISCYETSLHYKNDPNTLANLGAIYTKHRQFEKAISCYKKALTLKPKLITALTNLGATYIEMDELKNAEMYLRKSIALNQNVASLWRNLTLCTDYLTDTHPDIAQIQANLINPAITEEEKIHYYFALGNVYEKLKKYDIAFAYYEKANKMQSAVIAFNPSTFSHYIQQVIKLYGSLTLKPFNFGSANEAEPLFIVGVPRSGKSLLETILSSHLSINAAAEIGISDVINKMPRAFQPIGAYPFWMKYLTSDQAFSMRNFYYSRLMRDVANKQCKYVIDTMPGNFMFFGLLYLLFPKAKFIVCQRDAMDVGLSIYFKYFVEGHGYSYDMKKIGQFYHEYHRMIAFWKEKLPGAIYEVSYENLINDPHKTLEGVIKYLNLESDTKFNLTKIKKDKIGISTYYEKFLKPLKEGMAAVTESMPDESEEQQASISKLLDNLKPEHVPLAKDLLAVYPLETVTAILSSLYPDL